MKAMIFSAGLGTRLKPLTDTMPKALVPLAGKPLLQWQVERLRDAGIRDIIVNVHHFPDMIIDTIRRNNGWGCHITVSDERDLLLDTGGGLRKAIMANGEWLMANEPILACNVDILSNIDLRALMASYTSSTSPSSDTSSPRTPRPSSLLVVSDRPTQRYLCFDPNDRLCGWTNISTGELRGHDGRHLAFSGMQILSPEALALLPQMPADKFSLIDFYLRVMNELPLQAYVPTDYRMMDVGKIDQIAQAEAFAANL
ncbi:MAG: nucleotidyltransferase family protein [Paludibacteraceae bacterium]|nr:nucleotidyltransferase family protein [Paludibacteraceae bacterium]